MPFTVALIGRPNVGKSTLFNRLAGRRLALVSDTPGLTRDRREGTAEFGKTSFRIIDTAGMEDAPDQSLAGRMRVASEAAAGEADLCLFLIDARAGVTPQDEAFARMLRKSATPVLVVANKCEGNAGRDGYYDAFRLGLGEPVAISAEHGEAIGDLIGAIEPFLEAAAVEDMDGDDEKSLRLVIMGRPNAGKSTLVNRLVGSERMLTGAEAGITRDAISIDWQARGRLIRLYDTAGLRKRARVNELPEKLARTDALRAVRFAEVVVLLLDAGHAMEKQDLTLAGLAAEEGRAVVLAANKGDLVKDRRAFEKALREAADRHLAQIRGVPIVTLSAQEGWGIDHLLDAVFGVESLWNTRITTGSLNRWFADVVSRHPPPAVSGRRVRLRYLTQAGTRPPTFIAFCSRPDAIPDSYKRYIVNGIRDEFGLVGVPIRLNLRKGRNPYAGSDK